MTKRSKFNIYFLFIILFVPLFASSQSDIAEPEGYKMDEYRSATPQSLNGATVVNAETAHQLFKNGDVQFIDVLPSPRRPKELAEDSVWLPQTRLNIPGSIWLADVGYGVLSDELDHYFLTNLQKLVESGNDKILFYCNVDCWMSYNAAKRALNYGFKHILWFPGGVDEWADHGFALTESKPVKISG